MLRQAFRRELIVQTAQILAHVGLKTVTRCGTDEDNDFLVRTLRAGDPTPELLDVGSAYRRIGVILKVDDLDVAVVGLGLEAIDMRLRNCKIKRIVLEVFGTVRDDNDDLVLRVSANLSRMVEQDLRNQRMVIKMSGHDQLDVGVDLRYIEIRILVVHLEDVPPLSRQGVVFGDRGRNQDNGLCTAGSQIVDRRL